MSNDGKGTPRSGAAKKVASVAAATVMATASLTGSASAEGELTIYNPTWDMGPVVYDNVGHSIGAGERRVIPPLDSMGCYVLAHGWIIVKKGMAVCPPASSAQAEGEAAEESATATEQQETGESVLA
jgi:hypothetical protein